MDRPLKDIHDKIFLIILILFFFIKLTAALLKPHQLLWDEAVYIGMGKYLFSGGTIGLWENIRPVALPFILGLFWKTGTDVILLGEILEAVFASCCIIMVYLIGCETFNKKTALGASILLVFTPIFFFYSSFILTGIPSTFFALLAIFCFIKEKEFIAGIFTGISFLFRFTQGLLILSFLCFLAFNSFKTKKVIFLKKAIKITSAMSLTILPLLVFNMYLYPNENILIPLTKAAEHQDSIVNKVIIPENKLSYLYNLVYYPLEYVKSNFLFIFLISGVFYFIKQDFNKRNTRMVFTVMLIYLSYFTYISHKQLRFGLVFLPYFCLISSYGFNMAFAKIQKHSLKHSLLKFLLLVIVLIGFFSSGKIILEQYNLRADKEPPVFEFYRYFESHKTEGTILTTNPVPVAYSDVKMIPFYNTVDDALEIYEEKKEQSQIIVYTSEFYPCFNDLCYKKRNLLFEDINSSFKEIFHKRFDQDYFILERAEEAELK
ncbi:glycosyltransferase family 39 protein [Candidatus Woesearchaeota archaeon]|nr:glycosyltransferase family 39 protein [Candidatus Woesearchaeota archaeon]